jgi:hypothetical protein
VTASPIPVFVMEEHHEAFLVWMYAIRQGLLNSTGNTLLHVDEHSDWSVPRLRSPFDTVGATLAEVADFTYNELDIGNFIWPAIYNGLFPEVYFLRTWQVGAQARRDLFVCSANPQRTEFITGPVSGLGREEKDDVRKVAYETLTPAGDFFAAGPVVLDIDLDYFSSLAYPEYENPRVEITHAAYENFKGDPYHILRISPGGKVTAQREEDRCFLVFNDFPPQQPRISLEAVHQRLTDFFGFLERRRVQPVLVDICRSRRSGYTPKAHLELIESEVLRGLSERYDLHIQSIQRILARGL